MDNDALIQFISLGVLILCSAFFSSAETSLVSCNKIRMKTLADNGNKRALMVQKILTNQTKMIGTILVGNNIANIGASSLMTSITLTYLKSVSVSVTAGILTLVILIWGEIMPKSIATVHANKIAMAYAPIIRMLMFLLTPVVVTINQVSNLMVRLFHLDKSNDSVITEQELKELIDVGHREGVLESEEKIIINNLLEFTDATAEEVMTPRIDMVFIRKDDDYDDVREVFQENKFTRYPIYDENKDEVIGVINVKDLLTMPDRSIFRVEDYMREAYFTYEGKSVAELLLEMRQTGMNMAIVLDEYGLTAGLITLEDLLEELVGEIRDEYDEDERDEIIANGDGTYTVDAMTRLDEINEHFGLQLSGDGYDNLAGYISEELDHIPKAGESVETDGVHFKVTDIRNNRLISVLVTPRKKENDTKNDA